MADFGKAGGKAEAPTKGPIKGGTPRKGVDEPPKSTPASSFNTKNPGTRGNNRGWQ